MKKGEVVTVACGRCKGNITETDNFCRHCGNNRMEEEGNDDNAAAPLKLFFQKGNRFGHGMGRYMIAACLVGIALSVILIVEAHEGERKGDTLLASHQ